VCLAALIDLSAFAARRVEVECRSRGRSFSKTTMTLRIPQSTLAAFIRIHGRRTLHSTPICKPRP